MSLSNITLTPQLVQAVRDTIDIVDIAAEHTKLQRAGRRSKGLCPLHKEKTPSFSVDHDRGLFYCFGCGQGGDAIRLHQLLSGDDFPAAIESLARRYGIPLPRRQSRPGERREPDLEPVLEAAETFFRERLTATPSILEYLARRRIPEELIERYRLGYAPDDWRELVGALGTKFPMKELEAAGLVARSQKAPDKPYDRFRHRLIFPIRALTGRLVGFGGRTMGDDQAKYINSSETARFSKGTLLYGLDVAKRSIRDGGVVLLVEGYFDVLGAVASGLQHCVASMGTALTEAQCRLLSRFADDVVVGYDGDAAGVEAYRRALPLLLSEGLGVRRPALPEGEDPDSYRMEHGEEKLVKLVEQAPDAVAQELERLVPRSTRDDPRAQARAGRAVSELLEPIGDGILRYSYARMAADRIGVPVELIWKRARGGDEAAPRPSEQREGRNSTVRSLEERVLQEMLAGEVALPPPAELPPEDAFFDPVCRNIYRAFRALYKDGEGPVPASEELLAEVGSEGKAVDQLARILLERPVAAGSEGFRESLRRLERRWRQLRLKELSAEIRDAQRVGDDSRLARLLDEKTILSRSLHRLPESG